MYCEKCKVKNPKDKRRWIKTPLHYRQIHGMRVKSDHTGKLMYHAYCPVCKEYSWQKK